MNRSRAACALVCLGLFVGAACSNDDDDAAASTSPEDAGDAERFRTDGLTLVYPTDVYEAVASAEPGAEGAAVTAEFDAPDEPAAGEMTVVVVRTATGAPVEGLSAEDGERLSSLDGLTSEEDPPDGFLEFVNGAGVRTIEDDEYRFDGLSNDGRFLVGFAAGQAGGDVEEQLDVMIETVFVDGAAEVYATDECVDGVELVTENGLPEDATVAPGEEVTATWEIRNSGDCTWTDAYSWVFTGGEPVTVLSTGSIATVGPGESTEVTVVFVAPTEPGQYAAQWQLQSPADFEPLGTPAFVVFRVEA